MGYIQLIKLKPSEYIIGQSYVFNSGLLKMVSQSIFALLHFKKGKFITSLAVIALASTTLNNLQWDSLQESEGKRITKSRDPVTTLVKFRILKPSAIVSPLKDASQCLLS